MTSPATTDDHGPRSPWLAHLAEVLVLVAFTAFTAWPFLDPDRLVIGFDTITYGGPNTSFTAEQLRHGHLATWNDRIFGGVAHLANPNAAALYPLKWLFLGVGPERALGLLAATHLAVLAIGAVALGRQLRWRPPASLVLGVVLVGCGSTMVKVLQTEQLAVLAWVPLLLCAIDRVLASEAPARPVAALGAVTGIMLVAGHPQIVYIVGPVAATWAAARALDRRQVRRVGRLAAGALLGALLACAQLLPTAAWLDQTASSQERPASLAANPAYTAKPSLVAGNVLGDVGSVRQDAVGGSGEANLSVGAAAATLVGLGVVLVVGRGRRHDRWTVLGAAAVSAAAWGLALGPRTAIYRLAADVVPGFAQARVPGRWLLASSVGLALVAGLATDRVARGTVRLGRVLAVLASAIAVAVLLAVGSAAGWLLLPPSPAPRTWVLAATAVVAAAAAVAAASRRQATWVGTAALVLLAAAPTVELALAGRHSVARAAATSDAIAGIEGTLARRVAASGDRAVALTFDRFDDAGYLLRSLRPNANVTFDVRSIDGYDGGPQLTLRWMDTMEALAPDFDRDLTLRAQGVASWPPSLLARFGVRWALVDAGPGTPPPPAYLPGWIGPLGTEGTLELWENPAWEGEAVVRFATVATAPADAGAALRALTDGGDEAALVDPDGPALTCTERCAAVPAALDRRAPGRLHVEVASDRDGLLVVAEQAAEGWRAEIDGRPAPVVVADGMFLGVVVPAGTHQVALRYDAPGLRAGLALTTVGVLAVAGLLAAGPRARWPLARRPWRARRSGGDLGDGQDRLAEGRAPAGLGPP